MSAVPNAAPNPMQSQACNQPNFTALKQERDDRQAQREARDSRYYSFEEDTITYLYVLPPWSAAGQIGRRIWKWFAPKDWPEPKFLVSLKTWGRPCPIESALQSVRKQAGKEALKGRWPRERGFFNALIAGHQKIVAGVPQPFQPWSDAEKKSHLAQIVDSPATVYDEICAKMLLPNVGNITDLSSAVLVAVTRTGKELETEYKVELMGQNSPTGFVPQRTDVTQGNAQRRAEIIASIADLDKHWIPPTDADMGQYHAVANRVITTWGGNRGIIAPTLGGAMGLPVPAMPTFGGGFTPFPAAPMPGAPVGYMPMPYGGPGGPAPAAPTQGVPMPGGFVPSPGATGAIPMPTTVGFPGAPTAPQAAPIAPPPPWAPPPPSYAPAPAAVAPPTPGAPAGVPAFAMPSPVPFNPGAPAGGPQAQAQAPIGWPPGVPMPGAAPQAASPPPQPQPPVSLQPGPAAPASVPVPDPAATPVTASAPKLTEPKHSEHCNCGRCPPGSPNYGKPQVLMGVAAPGSEAPAAEGGKKGRKKKGSEAPAAPAAPAATPSNFISAEALDASTQAVFTQPIPGEPPLNGVEGHPNKGKPICFSRQPQMMAGPNARCCAPCTWRFVCQLVGGGAVAGAPAPVAAAS